jgi:hypothetical protein
MSIEIRSARRTYSFASAADHTVVNGVLTATATAVTPQTLTAGDLNGSLVLTGGVFKPARMLTITRSLATGAYTTDPIVLTTKDTGAISIPQANADGGDTLTSVVLINSIVSLALPAMGSTGGSIQVGVTDVGPPIGGHIQAVKMVAAGVLPVAYDDQGAETDTIDADTSELHIAPRRIATANITSGFTIYMQ